jgi:hypothetical protein
MPVAMAATLVLAFTIILRVNTTEVPKKQPEVTVQTISRPVEIQPAAAPPPPEMARAAAPAEAPPVAQADDNGAMVVDIGADDARAERSVSADAMAAPAAKARARGNGQLADSAQPALESAAGGMAERDAPAASAAAAPAQPDYRRDAKSWLAEIDRLRATGDKARADAELAEYKREHRAYAVSPDR